jgi:hypothetical protein
VPAKASAGGAVRAIVLYPLLPKLQLSALETDDAIVVMVSA